MIRVHVHVHTTSCLMPAIISFSFSGSGVPTSLNIGWIEDVDDTSSGSAFSFFSATFFSAFMSGLSHSVDAYLWRWAKESATGFHVALAALCGRLLLLSVQSVDVRGALLAAALNGTRRC